MNRLPQKASLVAQTTAILRESIQSAEWDQWLPTEQELCEQLHIGRVTLRAALSQLQREGCVRSSQGKRREIVVGRRPAVPARSARVLLLVPVPLQFSRPFSIFWANELRKHLAEAGYQLEVHSGHAPYGPNLAQSLEVLIQQIRPAGCVLTSSNEKMQRWFSEHRVPCVIVGSRHPGVELASVDTAYRAACRHAVGQFLGRGHRRLAFLNPDSGAAGDLESEQGFNEGVARSNPADVQASVVRHDGTVPDICKKVDSLLRQPDPPTAFLVSRSGCVLTVMGHLMQSGVRLPQDAALISRDHDPFLEDMVPSVARYVVNPGVMAHRISRAVLELLQSGIVSPANCQILPEFKGGETFGRKAAMR